MALTSLAPAQGLQNFVDESSNILVASNNMSAGTLGGNGIYRTQVIGRPSIVDLSQNLKAHLGVERILTQNIVRMAGEQGPLGEPVYSVLNDTRGLIRFVGSWANDNVTHGPSVLIGSNTTDFVEVTFYGTGLNVLIGNMNGGSLTMGAQIDGNAIGASITPSTVAATLVGRLYAPYQTVCAASGLTLGIHTIKIRNTAVWTARIDGFEILNEATTLKTNPGSAFVNGKKLSLTVQDAQAFGSGFTNTYGSAGAKGGRVLVYLDSDRVVKKDIQYVDASQLNLTAADHTNEEVLHVYNSKEFGSGRSDDLSLTFAAASRAFVLDDNSTGMQVSNTDGVQFELDPFATSSYITISFVGTGLDATYFPANETGGDTQDIIVDGVTILSGGRPYNTGIGSSSYRTAKIVSGLPYGSHVVKFNTANGGLSDFIMKEFIVYGPKKPVLPANAVELADYNLMATYVANATAGLERIGTGVLRKSNTREAIFIGAGWSISQDIGTAVGGFTTRTSGNGDSVERYFWGTGFEYRTEANTASTGTVTVALQSLTTGGSLVTLTSGNFPGLTVSSYGGLTFTYATGNMDQNDANTPGSGFSVNGLPLGLYRIKFTNGAAASFRFDAFDIITPIHIAKSNSVASLSNVSSIGSCSMNDTRNTAPVKDSSSLKAWGQAIGITSSVTTTSTVYVPAPDLSLTLKTSGGALNLNAAMVASNSNLSGTVVIAFFVDGVQVSPDLQINQAVASADTIISHTCMVQVSPGFHKIDLFWKVGANTGTLSNVRRILTAKEM